MQPRFISTVVFLVISSIPFSTAVAQSRNIAAGLRLSTLGLGADLIYGINDQFNIRGTLRAFSYGADGEEDGIDYEGDLKLSSFGVLADYHPWGGGFHITTGLMSNGNEFNLEAVGPSNAEIGDVRYDIDGKLNTDVTFNSAAPYLGIGWGNAFGKGSQFSLSFDVGILFQGSPEAEVSAAGTATELSSGQSFQIDDMSNPLAQQFQNEIDKEEQNLNDEMEGYEYYPVISLGLNYQF